MSVTVQVGNEEIRLEPFSGLKATRVMRTIEHITEGVPAIMEEWAQFVRTYEASHETVLDRAFARAQLGPEPLMDEEPILDANGNALTDDRGQVLVRRTAKIIDGRPVMGPDPLGHMTEEDWQASDNKYRRPRSPSMEECVVAIFPKALNLAEMETMALLALIAMPEAELVRHWRAGSLADEPGEEPLPREKWGALRQRAEELLFAPADHIIDLAIAAGEVVDQQFVQKIARLREGEALGKLLRLFGMSPSRRASKSDGSATLPTSSTDSQPDPDTAGTPQPPSEPTGVSSEPSLSG